MRVEPVEKRKVSELIALYEFEPDLKDIYVEGISDKCLVNRFILSKNPDVNIVEINDIDFSELTEQKPHLKSNCKQKVIELSQQIHDSKIGHNGIFCIVDRDFDDFLGTLVKNNYLFYTDYSSIEMYFYNESSLNNFFRDILHGFPHQTNDVIECLRPILNDIYCFKLALLQRFGADFEINRFDFKRLIRVNKANGQIDFKIEDYMYRYLNSNGLMSVKKDLERLFTINKKENDFSLDLKIRGHDFITLFYYYIDKIKNDIRINLDTLERVVFACVDLEHISKMSLFNSLENKYASA